MSAIDYPKLVSSILNRTEDNLNTIRKTKKYEVTQLLNSLWGFIVFPYEYFSTIFNADNRIELINNENIKRNVDLMRQLIKKSIENKKFYNDYPKLNKRKISDWTLTEVLEFIKHIRNAISHSGNNCLLIKCSETNNSIVSVIFKDINKQRKQFFCIEMDVENTLPNFKDITTNIFKTMENFYDMRCRFEVKNLNEIEKLNTLMKTQCIEIYNKK